MRILLLLIFAFGLSATKGSNVEKLVPLQRTIEISSCLETSNSSGACTIDDMSCWSCEDSGSNTCCQVGHEKCYYWLTDPGDN